MCIPNQNPSFTSMLWPTKKLRVTGRSQLLGMFITPSKDWQNQKKNEIKTMFFTLNYRRPVVWEVFPSISRISFPRFAPAATPCLHPGVCGHGRQGLQFGILSLRKAPNQQGGQHEEAHGQEEEQMPGIRWVTWERPAPDWSNSACMCCICFISFPIPLPSWGVYPIFKPRFGQPSVGESPI